MKSIKNVEEKIREINSQFLKEFETELKLSKKRDNTQEKSIEYKQQLNKFLQSAGIDTKETDSRTKAIEKELDQHLKTIRPGLINRSAGASSHLELMDVYNEIPGTKNH